MKFKKTHLTACSVLICLTSFCQFDSLVKKLSLLNTFHSELPREKIFVHYDKPCYNIDDTLWLKGYIVSAKDHKAHDSSRIAYIEIIKTSGEVIKRVSTYCAAGIFFASIKLNDADFKQGAYLLRAYTNYMRNYGDSLFFESPFKIINPGSKDWNLSVRSLNISKKRFLLNASLQSDLQEKSLQKKISVILRAKNKIIFKQATNLDNNGAISIDTLLTKESNDSSLFLEISGDDNLNIQLPVQNDNVMKTDLQFLPEGGSFVVNKLTQLGFKAVNSSGSSLPVKGKIENSQKQLITTFSSVHNGMGTVWLKPEINERYTAILENGLTFPLPVPMQSGTQLQITNDPGSDSIRVLIDASTDLYNKVYFFRASAKGITCAMGTIYMKDKPYRLSISKKAFPSGICRFTLYDSNSLPVNERIILIWHHDALMLNLVPQKPAYGNRDSVHILLTAKNSNNEPTIGSFSIAVIDTGQVHYPKHTENIISYLLLSADIKGIIEEPSYYFDNPLPLATEALMLTQGWIQYNHIFSNPAFEYEREFSINGKVTNLLNKPVASTNITLLGKDGKANTFISNTQTDKNGSFTVNDFPVFLTDSVSMIIKAVNKKGKSFGIGLEIDEPDYPGSHPINLYGIQNEIIHDTITAGLIQKQAKTYSRLKKEKDFLPEVVVISKTKIRGSKNLNTDGGADQVISPKILEKLPKENLLDVLSKKVPGFHKGPLPKSQLQVYKRNGDFIVFIIDGYNLNQAYDPVSESVTAFTEYEETFLKYITAEEVAGIEIMTSLKNTFAYERYYNYTSNALITYTFIEITTFSGHGAFNKKMPGIYLYKPLAPVISKTFYSPRYSPTGRVSGIPDYRSTLYWKPDIITNEKGEAAISFYTSDSNNGFLAIAQGTDLNGGLGVAILPLVIQKEEKMGNE